MEIWTIPHFARGSRKLSSFLRQFNGYLALAMRIFSKEVQNWTVFGILKNEFCFRKNKDKLSPSCIHFYSGGTDKTGLAGGTGFSKFAIFDCISILKYVNIANEKRQKIQIAFYNSAHNIQLHSNKTAKSDPVVC